MADSLPKTVRMLPFSLATDSHYVFAYDITFFVAKECKSSWRPYGHVDYSIDPQSPLSLEFMRATKFIMRARGQSYQKAYLDFVTMEAATQPRMFLMHARQTFRICFDRSCDPGDFFHTAVYVARLGLMFYEHGDRSMPDSAAVIIGEALQLYGNLYGPGFFESVRSYTRNVVENKKDSSCEIRMAMVRLFGKA